jgi:4-amino-4-deoxy-L-arabinose transferase-like glycosyltransferase
MGLIDMAFSWVTYLFFMLSYYFYKKEKYLLLFTVAYLITAVGWMMKGLPSIVFLGISLLVLFLSEKKYKMLFNWRHFAGIFIFIMLVGGYYFLYFRANDHITYEKLFSTLFDQSMRRTGVRFGFVQTFLHILSFPLEMLYHFLPWTILTLGLFVRGMLKKIWDQPFLRYNILILGFNILPYWTSPEVFPRYILMLLPLYFVVVSWVYMELKERKQKIASVIEVILGITLILASIAPWASGYADMVKDIKHVLLISAILSLVLILLTILYWRSRQYRLFWFAISILVLRIGFDLLILPTRQINSDPAISKELAYALAEKTKGKKLYSYWDKNNEGQFFWYMRNIVSFRYHFHLSVARDEIIYHNSEKDPDALYFALPSHIENDSVEIIDMLERKHGNRKPIPLIRFLNTEEDQNNISPHSESKEP